MENSNLEVYADPINYDLESGDYDPTGSILLRLATQAPGPVLELGCGTGRVTIPLARQGLDMTGLELLPQMLERAREKAAGLPIRWVNADAQSFQLNDRYGLIFTAGAIVQHLLERADQEAMLARVREHLAQDGRFVIDAAFKRPTKMVDVVEPEFWYTFEDDQGREIEVSGTDHYNHVRQIWTQTLYRRRADGDETKQAQPVTLTLRYFMPQELESLLQYNGFIVLDRFGSWQGDPLTDKSAVQIYVCGGRE